MVMQATCIRLPSPDLDTLYALRFAGNCVAEIKQFCSDIKPGEGRLANCVSDQIAESETADSEDGKLISSHA